MLFSANADARRYWVSHEDTYPNAAANELMATEIEIAVRRFLLSR